LRPAVSVKAGESALGQRRARAGHGATQGPGETDTTAGGQSGSARQVNKITLRRVWNAYVSAVGEAPFAPTSKTNPLLVNLQDVIGKESMEAFGNLVIDRTTQLTSWRYQDFGDTVFGGRESNGCSRGLQVQNKSEKS
jgi:hypothetical protein